MKAFYKIKAVNPLTLFCQAGRHHSFQYVGLESKPFLILSRKFTTTDTRVKGSENLKVDKELQLSFQGFLVQLSALSTLESDANFQLLEKIHAKFYPKKGFFDQIAACVLYAKLQHPLLKKYNFDIFEFSEGARHGYKEIVRAISSTDFSNYCNGFSTMSRDAELLKATVHPKIYRAAKEACQIILEKKQKFTLKDIHIKNFRIVSVNVEVVDEEVFEMQQAQEATPSSSSATTAATDKSEAIENNSEKADETVEADSDIPPVIKFPLGSVLAHVVIYFESEDNYDVVSEEPLQNNANFQQYELANTKQSFWTFSACISGHVDMAWQVVRI